MRITQTAKLKEIAKRHSLELILLFGSQSLKKTHKESDFDIAYLSRKELNLGEESELILELTPIFRSENIDLTNLKKSPPLLFYAIFKDAKILYEGRPLLFASLRAYAFKKYIETKPLYEEKIKRFQKKIKRF